MSYCFKITCSYNYYGYPEALREYIIEGDYFTLKLKWLGNHGFDIPQVISKKECNGYYWSMHNLMNMIYNQDEYYYKFKDGLDKLKENEFNTFVIDKDNIHPENSKVFWRSKEVK